ncbi:MAG: radical SAM protein [Planctomycetes bacterium]|nr:radical SAM protein [Planctomycetota bacterium]
MKVNVDQYALDSRWREWQWHWQKQHRLAYWQNRLEWYLYPHLQQVPKFPLHVDFEISSLCNLQCPMCYRPQRKNANDGLMKLEDYKAGIEECARHKLYSIRLSWRGEPTLHPDLPEMVAFAREQGIREVSFITNGVRLDEALSRQLVEAGLGYLSVSIDGVGDTYEKIRYPAKFNETVDRLRTLRRLRDSLGKGFPRIRTNSIWSAIENNPQEYFQIFSPIVDFITINPDYDHTLKETQVDPNHVCQYLFQRMTIMWDGTIPLCICDKSKEIILGQLGKDSLQDIWRGSQLNGLRRMQQSGQTREIAPCTKCQRSLTTAIGNQRDVKK